MKCIYGTVTAFYWLVYSLGLILFFSNRTIAAALCGASERLLFRNNVNPHVFRVFDNFTNDFQIIGNHADFGFWISSELKD